MHAVLGIFAVDSKYIYENLYVKKNEITLAKI